MPDASGQPRLLRRALYVAVALLLVFLGVRALGWPPHGSIVRAEWAPNHGADFDFSDPPCDPAPRASAGPDDVVLRYLGTGGVYVEWRDAALLTAPYFSNASPLRAVLGSVRWDSNAIERGLAGLPLGRVHAVLVGHSHYDHLADLPPILLGHLPRARVYVNRSGRNMLAAFDGIVDRTVDVEQHVGRWIPLTDAEGRALPIRVMPLEAAHAPHLRWLHYGRGEVRQPWDTWNGKPLRAMKEGRTFAFLVDLLDENGRVAFRIHSQDAAASSPAGFSPDELIEQRAVDLAVLCMPSYWLVEDYPEGLLRHSRAKHALLTHYEDFLRPTTETLRFVALLSDQRADRFIERVAGVLGGTADAAAGPDPCCCGPCGASWSMPLPGEWLRFRTRAASTVD